MLTVAMLLVDRQADRQGRLEDVVQAAVVPRGRVSKSAMVEYSAYLSRMSQLEETRRSNGLNQGRRYCSFLCFFQTSLSLLRFLWLCSMFMQTKFDALCFCAGPADSNII